MSTCYISFLLIGTPFALGASKPKSNSRPVRNRPRRAQNRRQRDPPATAGPALEEAGVVAATRTRYETYCEHIIAK